MPENPFVIPDEEEDEIQVSAENANFKALRDYAKRIERENKALEKQAAELSAFRDQVEAQRKAEALKQAGLSEKHAALFLKVNGDAEVTAESAQMFANEYGLTLGEASSPSEASAEAEVQSEMQAGQIIELPPPTPTPTPAFAPTQNAGIPSQQLITDLESAQKLAVDNPIEYTRLREAGRIKLEKLPGSDR